MAKIIKFLTTGILIQSMLVSCAPPQDNLTKGLLVPHHLLVDKYIEEAFDSIPNENIERVVILSPNHFGYGFHYIQTDTLPPFNSKVLSVEPKYFNKEHGIQNLIPFIKDHFPKAKITPIIFKEGTPQPLIDLLLKELAPLKNTLFIASIDFTHKNSEETALKNDERTISWLKSWSLSPSSFTLDEIADLAGSLAPINKESVAMDSPSAFYAFMKIMEFNQANNFTLLNRTSSANLLNLGDPLENTSHIFAKFSK